MGNVGLIIKNERFKRNIKQISLAKGICSVSYLSRIENNSIEASEEVLQLLLKRLNIELNEFSQEEEERFLNKLYSIYKIGIVNRDKEQVLSFINQYEKQNIHFSNEINFFTYKLYMFRMLLVVNENINEVEDEVNFLLSFKEKLNHKQQFMFNLNLGLYYYLQGDYFKGLKKLENSFPLLSTLKLVDWELADYHNALSVSYLRCDNHYNAIKYISKTLNYYKESLIFERVIDSYLTMGTAQKGLLDYHCAEESLQSAKKIAHRMKLTSYNGIIAQNLGTIYAAQGKYDSAITHYEQSLNYSLKEMKLEGCLVAFLCLSKEYFKQGNFVQAVTYAKKGLDFIQEHDLSIPKLQYMSYYHHFTVYYARSNDSKNVASVLIKAIQYFEEIDLPKYVQRYSIILANYYFSQNKFKSASLYYQKSNDILLKQKSIYSVEDL